MSRQVLRLALLPVIAIVLGSCRDVPTAPADPEIDALLNAASPTTLAQAIDATIVQIFPKGHRTSVAARWRGIIDKLEARQPSVAHRMLAELAGWIERHTPELTPLSGETRTHAAARLVLYMSVFAHRDPSEPPPAIPAMGPDAVLEVVDPKSSSIVITPDGKAGVALEKGSIAEPTVLVIHADAQVERATCAGPLDTELCQSPGYYHFETFPHRPLSIPARVAICGPVSAPQRLRVGHALPSAQEGRVANGIVADGVEILPTADVADFLPCGTGGLTKSFSEFGLVDPVPQHSRYCPTETERTATYGDLDAAIANAPESNVVVVCDGTWPTNQAAVNKAVTIRSESPGGAMLVQPDDAAAGEAVMNVSGVASGQVRLVDLGIRFKWIGVRASGTFDQLTLDSVSLTGPGGNAVTIGLQLDGSSVATAQVRVTRSRFLKSYYGVRQGEPVAIDTYHSHFEDIGWAGLILWSTPNGLPFQSVTGQSMQKADVVGNVFVNIPSLSTGAAVSIQAAGDHLIQSNRFMNTESGPGTASGASSVFITRSNVVAANTRPARIRDNVIIGHAAVDDPAVQGGWGVGFAFRVINGIAGISDSVTRNSATDVFIGLDANAPSEMTAFDNTFDGTYIAVRKVGASLVSITRNDFTRYTFPMSSGNTLPGNPSLSNGSLACNWWGSAAPPAPLAPPVNPGGYLPYATEPIANTEVECAVSTASPPVVRACATSASGSEPTVPTIGQAIQFVAPGGTVKVCDGTHVVFATSLNAKALTIEGEGPGIPTLDAGGNNSVFTLGTSVANTRATVLRKLRMVNAALNAVNVTNQYGSLLIDRVAFHPSHGVVPPGQTLANASGVNVANAVGGGVTVQNSTFEGGDIGVNTTNSQNVVISGNTFTNHLNGAIRGNNGGSIIASGNTVNGCGIHWCIGIFGGSTSSGHYKLLDNTITVDFEHPTRNALQLQQGTFEVAGNTITGAGGSREAAVETWPISTAIAFNHETTVTVNRNTISGAGNGLWFDAAAGTGVDNTISAVWRVLSFTSNSAISISRSDFSGYAVALSAPGNSAALARCNWWGSTNGPTNPETDGSTGIPVPWAFAPIANTGMACDPNAPPPSVVRVCSAPGGPNPTVGSIPAAIALVAPGGTIAVCDGTYVLSETNLGAKSLSIEGEGPGVPIIDGGGGSNIFRLGGLTATTAIGLRRLRLQNATYDAVNVGQHGGSLLVDQVEFRPPHAVNGAAAGLRVIGSSAAVTVKNSTFVGGDIGVEVNESPNVSLVINANSFTGQHNLAIAAGSGSSMIAVDNTISGCLGLWCVQVSNGPNQGRNGTIKLLNNTINVDFAHPLQQAMNLHEANFEIAGNVITGTGGSRDPNDLATWPMHSAISVSEPSTVVMNGNRLSGAHTGIGMGGGVTGTGSNNVIQFTSQAIGSVDGVTLTRSDFTNYTTAIGQGSSGSLRCNWWGSSSGPTPMPANVNPAIYTPWANVPIAGTATPCDPNAPTGPPTSVRVCSTSGSGVTVPTATQAYALVAEGGTILFCDGTHVVQNLTISKPVVITAEGPGRPTLDGGDTPTLFNIQNVPAGRVTISRLRFTGGGNGQVAIHDNVAAASISYNEFHPPQTHPAPAEPLGYRFGVSVSGTGLGTLTIDHNTFVGGDQGIHITRAAGAQVDINDNSFSRQATQTLGITGPAAASYNVERNTFAECLNLCIFTANPLQVLGNTFTANVDSPVENMLFIYTEAFNPNPSTIADNIFTGIGSGGTDRNSPRTYPVWGPAISIQGGVARILRNRITNAYQGISVWNASVVTATDNLVQRTFAPLSGKGATNDNVITANWNDFVDFVTPVAVTERLDLAVLNIRCNWWGNPAGLLETDFRILPGHYTPFATAPVAGLPRPACNP